QRLSRPAGKLLEVRHGTDCRPQIAQAVQINLIFHPGADVARGLARPDNVGKISGGVVKSRNANARIMRGGKEGIARSEACAENAELTVTLLLQPVEAAA